jgi:hypothetical protein
VEASREGLARFFSTVLPHLNEVQRRMVAGAMAGALGRGGKSAVAEASGMSRNTVIKAEREVTAGLERGLQHNSELNGDRRERFTAGASDADLLALLRAQCCTCHAEASNDSSLGWCRSS